MPTSPPLSESRPSRWVGPLRTMAAVLLATACTSAPDDLSVIAPWQAPRGGVPTGLALRPGADATFVPPTAPAPQSRAEVAGRTAGAAVIYPLAGVVGAAMCGPAAILCAPVFLAVGIGTAAAEGARGAEAVRTPEEVAATTETLRRVADPARLGACLRRTLAERSGGRLVAEPETPGGDALRVAIHFVSIGVRTNRSMLISLGDFNPEIVLHVGASAMLTEDRGRPPDTTPDARAIWSWQAEPRRYYAATDEDGRALQADLGLAVGILAQRILADLYPGSITPPPTRHGSEAERFRASCPGLAPAGAAGQAVVAGTAAAAR